LAAGLSSTCGFRDRLDQMGPQDPICNAALALRRHPGNLITPLLLLGIPLGNNLAGVAGARRSRG